MNCVSLGNSELFCLLVWNAYLNKANMYFPLRAHLNPPVLRNAAQLSTDMMWVVLNNSIANM